jgi:formamidopyrimidine-DNA glycosylase
MPELPEVETTVRALNRNIKNLRIVDVWTNYNSNFHKGKNNIKNRQYFKKFKDKIIGKKFITAERRAKNILVDLEGGITILVHMKMTGHFLYGEYEKKIKNGDGNTKTFAWEPKDKSGALNDPMNKFVRLVFMMSNGKHLAFSDLRKFAKIFYFPTEEKNILSDLKDIGPEPLVKNFGLEKFKKQLLKKTER